MGGKESGTGEALQHVAVRSTPNAQQEGGGLEIELPFEQWYQDFYPKLARTMTVMFSNVEVGREIADEAMARAFARWDKGSPPRTPNAWVMTVAVNEGRRLWGRRKRDAHRLAETTANLQLTANLDEPDIDLWRAVAHLPRRYREAIVLRYIADLSEAQVAETMGIKVGSAGALLHKARASLRRSLTGGTGQ